MSARVVVIGIDAANATLLEQWASSGRLPHIADLINRGLSGSIEGVEGFFVGSTWPSFYTGLNPAGHGIHYLLQLRSGTYDYFRPLEDPSSVGGIPIWRLTSEAGLRVAALDVPLSQPESEINGIQIVEWGSHDAVFGFRATPSKLERQVFESVGAYPSPVNCDLPRRSSAEFEDFISGLEHAVEKKTALTLELLKSEEWDLFIQVFTESHCVGHQCWHLHDPEHPSHSAQLADVLGDPLERIYDRIDRAVGRIVGEVGDAAVLVLSAHGMTAYRGAGVVLPEILRRLGVTRRKEPPGLRAGLKRLGRPLTPMLPASVKRLVAGALSTEPARDGRPRVSVDVKASHCFPVHNGQPVSGIRLNLMGREPEGSLRPGSEAEAFCDQLEHDLRQVVDRRTGRPLVTQVHRTTALYRGERRDSLPDLLVEWSELIPTGTTAHSSGHAATIVASSPKIGTVKGTNSYMRTGDHLPAGWFVLTADGLPAAARVPVSLMDFYPSICRLLGLPEPESDGVPVSELVEATRWHL